MITRIDATQLDDSKILGQAILAAMELAREDLKAGYCDFNKITKSFERKRSARDVLFSLGYTWRHGHLRAISAAYQAVFFNYSLRNGGRKK